MTDGRQPAPGFSTSLTDATHRRQVTPASPVRSYILTQTNRAAGVMSSSPSL